ncbi:MAG: hypothetical protein E7559_09110 [Ruminococcaceae bacterium]|nr:hypothetical protein [Oscillospiraceae bacterium]
MVSNALKYEVISVEEFSIRFLNNEGNPITRETVSELVNNIQKNCCSSAWLALDEYGEEDFLSVDICNGWAALAFNTWDDDGTAHMYQPVNPEYATSQEDAPVNIGGQTPVLKRNALNNLDLVAECVLCFAETGELYSELKWEEIK